MREWAEQGRKLGVLGRAVGWWIGDWVRFGNAKFGERYSRASRISGYDVQTLMNMVYVASRYDVTQRRETLSWSHHAELAPLEPKERQRWLDMAESERLSVRCLREEIRRVRRLGAGPDEKRKQGRAEVVCPECGSVVRNGGRGAQRHGGGSHEDAVAAQGPPLRRALDAAT